MIYGKMWTVVRPTVGIPLFLGACAIGSFSVHLALLNNTTWVKAFLEGGKSSSAAAASGAPAAPVAKK
ncbi:light-harvesting protein [Polynucleobacter sp. UB-Piko-W3]|uniref:light-harvesting protein n=1 Tax=Polynucleobacter sp. UB-Piko-W3 TaxID=1819735 RepID=UPI001C0D5688|nr:light-harvesting protein [Polynucleobacter sp. UB-Piko-W3]MBU3554403.1 light-harvesting protein [Polynucleobacter sp. UB-Piko-W3]